jgi:hypothetical protein
MCTCLCIYMMCVCVVSGLPMPSRVLSLVAYRFARVFTYVFTNLSSVAVEHELVMGRGIVEVYYCSRGLQIRTIGITRNAMYEKINACGRDLRFIFVFGVLLLQYTVLRNVTLDLCTRRGHPQVLTCRWFPLAEIAPHHSQSFPLLTYTGLYG